MATGERDVIVQNDENKQNRCSLINSAIYSFKPAVVFWDICKLYSPKSETAQRGVPSGDIMFAERYFIENRIKITFDATKLTVDPLYL